ncbi:MAG: hypothetical protein Q8M44_06480, partial [bacterium]|nr:hypothetical protein [bacterium]
IIIHVFSIIFFSFFMLKISSSSEKLSILIKTFSIKSFSKNILLFGQVASIFELLNHTSIALFNS